jgi:hypothetical protein
MRELQGWEHPRYPSDVTAREAKALLDAEDGNA